MRRCRYRRNKMSREIKFRAWHSTWNEMVYSNNEFLFDKREFYPFQFPVGFSHYPQDEEWQLMQFTGKTDNKDKEIWEGDIAKITLSTQQWGKGNKSKFFYAEVYWNSHTSSFEFKEPSGTGRYNVRNGGLENCEVIGNIYEHPELLKEKVA